MRTLAILLLLVVVAAAALGLGCQEDAQCPAGFETELVIDRDIADGKSASATYNLEEGATYAISVIVSQETDLTEGFNVWICCDNSNNILGPFSRGIGFQANTHRPIASTFIIAYAGPPGGVITPHVHINITNETGGSKHFHSYLTIIKLP